MVATGKDGLKMGGRGSAGGKGGAIGNPSSSAYKEAYKTEVSDKMNFAGATALDTTATKDTIGYQMFVYEDVKGSSLIADTRRELDYDKAALKESKAMGRSYGMTDDEIGGMQKGIKEKIKAKEKAIQRMIDARAEYELYKNQATAGNAKSARRKGQWM